LDPNVVEEEDSVQTIAGQLALGYAPWSFLQLHLSFAHGNRFYVYADTELGSRAAGTLGDPRFSLRTGAAVGRGFSLGARAEIWFPSSPSQNGVSGSAISPRFDFMASWNPPSFGLGLHFNIGYHHNRSSKLFEDTSWLEEPAALVISGINSSLHHLPFAFAVDYRFGPVAPALELVGDGSLDEPSRTTLSLAAGLRAWLGPSDAFQLAAGAALRLVGDDPNPTIDETNNSFSVWNGAPLFRIFVGFNVRLPIQATAPAGPGTTVGAPLPEPPPELGRIRGRISCGSASCGTGWQVQVLGTEASPFAVNNETGAFITTDLPPGTYGLEASLPGSERTWRHRVQVLSGQTSRVNFVLAQEDITNITGIRGRVTDFNGRPVQATIRIPAIHIETRCDEQGEFEVETAPGRYDVLIFAQGYATQTTVVEVAPGGIVVLNAELRRR
jgi:hypothetical protein